MTPPRRSLSPRALAATALVAAAVSCGDVPTLPGGIAYITPVIMPGPAVAVGDTLRDSTGAAVPIRLYAFTSAGDTVREAIPRFLVASGPLKGARITETGYVIGDSIRSVQIVGQVGERLQTPPAPLEVVPQPDSLQPPTTSRTITFPVGEAGVSQPIDVKVLAPAATPGGARRPVRAIIVRFRITRFVPATASFPDSTLVLIDEGNRFLEPQGRTAVDTTDASGTASRRVRALLSTFDSVEVTATATDLRGLPLRGSPARIVLSKSLSAQ